MTLEDVTVLLYVVQENDRVPEVVETVHQAESNNREKEDLLSRFNRLLEGDTNVTYQVWILYKSDSVYK